MVEVIKSRSALKHEVSKSKMPSSALAANEYSQTYLDDCADAFVTLAKNNSVTGQAMNVGMLAINPNERC
jgi:hypothetical protein